VGTIFYKGFVQGGQVVVSEPINMPDGSEVTIMGSPHLESKDNQEPLQQSESDIASESPFSAGSPIVFDFMTEEEQADDPQAIQRWLEELRSIPPVPSDPEAEAGWQEWEERMRRFNIEAVAKQFKNEASCDKD